MVSWREKVALIVDDNPVDRMVLKQILKKMGFREIFEAEDGSMANFKLQNMVSMSEKIDVIFLDVMMPRRNGISLLKDIKSDRLTKKSKIIMVTGVSERHSVEDSMVAGADDYIVKPVDATIVKSKLEKLFQE
jgi:two-component system chemotaxis response regulator CheY